MDPITSAPHYPSTAELAALRRTFGVPERRGHPSPFRHPMAGATEAERLDGIGYGIRLAPTDPPSKDEHSDGAWHTAARREASAMRSRAYARIVSTAAYAVGDRAEPADVLEREYGIPYAWRGAYPWRGAEWPAL